jgi:hypothetical protein
MIVGPVAEDGGERAGLAAFAAGLLLARRVERLAHRSGSSAAFVPRPGIVVGAVYVIAR